MATSSTFGQLPPTATLPQEADYVIPMPPSPTDGGNANQTFGQRSQLYIQYLACGEENVFLQLAQDSPTKWNNANILNPVMAKLEWLKLGNTRCTGTFNVQYKQGTTDDFFGNFGNPQYQNAPYDAPTFVGRSMHVFGPACSGTPAVFAVSEHEVPNQEFTIVTPDVSGDCLKAQVNFVLSQVQQGNQFPGTNGLPCNVSGSVDGDWDFVMKILIRILFLDSMRNGDLQSTTVLNPSVRQHIQNDLITVDGGPGPDSYSWTACGDNEKDTGTPQDDEDENDPGNDFLRSIGDIFTWLFRRLILILLFLGVTAVIATVAALTSVAEAALAVIGVAGIVAGQIPETENHRLMIESTRFLKNQLIIEGLGQNNGAPHITAAQANVKQWLLNRFQSIAKNDFTEYNARPYHGFTLAALRNLADFSTDPDVRNGAQMLIEYSAAKFAVGSNQGRRLTVFRRHFGDVNVIDGLPATDSEVLVNNMSPPFPAEIFDDFINVGDSGVSSGLLFNGQTQQLPYGSASTGTLGDVFDLATSQFLPNALIADLAVRKDLPYYQRIHHAGFEIYSSSPSTLITAGGIETSHAYQFKIGPVGIGDLSALFEGPDDLGAGVPTTVMFTRGQQNMTDPTTQSKQWLSTFISFRGKVKQEGDNDETFTDNLCVWHNFACGTNVRIPGDILQCLSGPDSNNLYFLNSSTCAGYTDGPNQFFLVILLLCPQNICITSSPVLSLNQSNAGFLEVVDNPSLSFDDFRLEVEQNFVLANPLGGFAGCLTGGNCLGDYWTVSGSRLQLDLRGHQDDSNSTGIIAVNGISEKHLDDWNLAEGDIINSQGDGVITINNPRLGTQLILDFSDVNHPCRRTGPNQPCTQQ